MGQNKGLRASKNEKNLEKSRFSGTGCERRVNADNGSLDTTFVGTGQHYYSEEKQGAAATVPATVDSSNRIVLAIGTHNSDTGESDIWTCRFQSPALIFTDGFEGETTGAWTGP